MHFLNSEVSEPATFHSMNERPTMQTIADVVGYSRMTVSMALRGSSEIAAKTREKICKVAEELGYKPNPLVSTLMAQRAGKKHQGRRIPIAIVNTFPDFAAFKRIEFYNQVLQGIQQRAVDLGFYGEVFHVNSGKGLSPKQLDRILINRNIHAAVILPMADPDQTFTLSWQRMSVAAIAHTWHGAPIHRAGADIFGNATLLMEKLLELGFRRPGFLSHDYLHARTRGIGAAAYHLFLNEHPELTHIPPLFLHAGKVPREVPITRWVKKHKPDIIIGHGNIQDSVNRIDPLYRKNFAYMELNLMPSQFGTISGVCPNPDVIGGKAVDIVVSRIHRNEFGLPSHPSMTMVTGTWHDGQSLSNGLIPSPE